MVRSRRIGDSRYEVTVDNGDVFVVFKEFFADGPSLFTWQVCDDAGAPVGEFASKKAALASLTGS